MPLILLQIQNTNHEFTNRLNLKCAISDLDSAITKRVEETSKPITQQIQQIHRQLAKTSTNEDLQNALSCKVTKKKCLIGDVLCCGGGEHIVKLYHKY